MRSFENTEKEGFSLVEFAVVIVVMAVVIAFMTPQLIKYVDRSNITYDRQRADDVKVAVREAMTDPEVLKDEDSILEIAAITSESTTQDTAFPISSLAGSETVFARKVAEYLGMETGELSHIADSLKSGPAGEEAMEIQVWFKEGSNSYVRTVIKNSDDGSGKVIFSD